MNATTTVKLGDLTAELTCNLCRGYLVDATTIIECLHSFCKSCIVVHLESSEYCPVCDVQLQPSRPLESVRSDKVLQEMVYKLVPGLYAQEMERRRQYYGVHPETVPAKVEEVKRICYITSNDDMQLSYEPIVANDPNEEAGPTFRRYIKCKAGASISVVKKLISQKFELNLHPNAVLDIMYGDRLIPDDFLLMDVAYKYSWNQKNESHLPLKYKVHGDPKFFEAETAPLISSDGAMESLKVLKLQAKKLNINGIVKKRLDGFGCVKSKKILQESVRSQLVLNESQQLVKPGKLPVDARIPKKGRPPKNKPSGDGTISQKPQVSQNGSTHSLPKEVQLSISEKGVMSATVPVTTAYNPANSKAGFGPFSFPRVEPMAVSPLHGFPRVKPQATTSSRSTWTPKQQNQVVMTQVPQETTVRTTTWHPKIPKGIVISQQEQELATKALKKKTSINMTNMETLKGVNRKLQEKLPDHYYKADILPLSSPPAASSTGVKPRSSTNGKVSPSKKQVFNVGEVRFTPVIAKKILSSPGSKLQLEDSPKRHKIFKSRQQESSNSMKPAVNPAVPPVNRFVEEPEELPDLDISSTSSQHLSVEAQESPAPTHVTLSAPQAPVSISVSPGNGIPAFLANHFNTQLQLYNLRNLTGLPNFSVYGQNSPTHPPDFLHSLSKMAQEQHHQPAFLSQMLAQANINGLPMYTHSSLQTAVASHNAGINHPTCNAQLPVQHSPNKRSIQMVVTNGHHTPDVETQFSDRSLAESERRVSDDLARLTAMVTTVSESEVPTKRRKSSSPSKLRRLLTAPRTPSKQKINGSHGTPSLMATVNASTSQEDSTTVNGSFCGTSDSSKSPDVEVSTPSDEVLKEPQAVSEPPQTITDSEEDGREEEDQINSADANDTPETDQANHLPSVTEEIAEETEDSGVEAGETEKTASENEIISETDEMETEDKLNIGLENLLEGQEEPEQLSPSSIVPEDECDDDDDNVLHIVEEKAELDQNEESSNTVDDTAQENPLTPPPTEHIEVETALRIVEADEKKTSEVGNDHEVLPLTEARVEGGLILPNINNNEIVMEQSSTAKEPAISSPNETSICKNDEPDAITPASSSA